VVVEAVELAFQQSQDILMAN